jgi:hypothetical protein
MNENNSYTTELIRIETLNIPTGPPSTEEEHILMEKYKEIYRIALIRSAMGGVKGIHSYNTKSGRI